MCKEKKQEGAGISDLPITYYACCARVNVDVVVSCISLPKELITPRYTWNLSSKYARHACLAYLPVMYLLAFN